MARVALENVTKLYGGKRAVDRVSFECREGEFMTITGPAGAGKTTILKMIAGIEKVTEGCIYFDGRLINDLSPQDRDVAMAFETYNLYPHLSVYENIAFPLRAPKRTEKLSAEQEQMRVEEIADFLGIRRLLLRRPTQLSGGEKQRVSLARVMVRKPQVYLLDEPIAHLDARLKFSTQTALKRLSSKLGTTIIYVSHDYREALGLSDRIGVLRKGGMEQIGTGEEIYHTPATDFVARFVGDPPTNLTDGELLTKEGKTFFRAAADFTLELEKKAREKASQVAHQNGEVRLGIRPAHVTVSKDRVSDKSFQLPIYAVTRSHQSAICTFELHDTFFQAMIENGVHYDMSERVWVDFDQEHLLFFPGAIQLSKK